MNPVLLSVIAALIMLDKYAIAEVGISQPIVSALILGWLFGNVHEALMVGAIFQLIFLSGLSIGREIPPDGQLAGLVGVGAFFLLLPRHNPATALFVCLELGLVASLIGSAFDIYVRQLNERLYHHFMRQRARLAACHFAGLATAFGRVLILGMVFYGVASLATVPIEIPAAYVGHATTVGVALGLANGMFLFFRRKTLVPAMIGLVCGLALAGY